MSALDDEEHVIEGLNLGADDYIAKPFRKRELLARVSANIRRKMEKTKSCKRKMRIAIGILLLEFAYMLFMGIGGVHATDETLPTVDGKLIHSIDHVEITSEMMNRYAKDMDPDIINRITEENGSCTPQEFLRAYTEQDPKFKKTLEKKYDITTQEDDFYDYR